MPVLWRTYFKAFIPTFLFYTFFLTLLSFLFRFKELVFFLDSGAPIALLGKFILYNTPFFFTLSCPLAAFIAGYLISNRLSQFGEWTAYSTLGLKRIFIMTPPLLIAVHLFLFVFILNADVCPKYRLLGKKIVLDAIYQNPSLIFKHFQPKSYPIAVTTIKESPDSLDQTVLIAGQKKGSEHLDICILKHVENEEAKGFFSKEILQVFSQDEGHIFTQLNDGYMDRKDIPTLFHFPTGYEEHHPLKGSISLSEFCRRVSVSLLPATLFFLATIYGISRNRRSQDSQLLLSILVAVMTYFLYLTVRSSIYPFFLWYLLIPLVPVPFILYRLKRELK
ncbi:LptF/LptG family permease [bacterium]|nr:LptF/LptG family permease [bacterium]